LGIAQSQQVAKVGGRPKVDGLHGVLALAKAASDLGLGG